MKDIDFTPLENHVLQASFNPAITLHRQRQVLAFGLVTFFCPVAVGIATHSWVWVAVAMMVYVAITIWEKHAYGNAVIAYKSVIRKLKARLDDLESTKPVA
jgi:hypothetical protein